MAIFHRKRRRRTAIEMLDAELQRPFRAPVDLIKALRRDLSRAPPAPADRRTVPDRPHDTDRR